MKQSLQSPEEQAQVAREIDQIMVEMHGLTMTQMLSDETLRIGLDARWAKYDRALAEFRRRRGPPVPRADSWTDPTIIALSACPGQISTPICPF